MNEGLFTIDAITPLFRNLSQKRRSGVLEVRSPDGDISLVAFQNGRIIAANRTRESEGEVVCDRLVHLKQLRHDDALCLLEGCGGDFTPLWRDLSAKHQVSTKLLADARRQYEMETLYRLRRLNGSPFRFRTELLSLEQERVIDVAPGQFLLDLVELEEADGKFVQEYGSLEYATRMLSRQPDYEAQSLSVLERRVCDALAVKCSLRELYEQTLLTEIELRAALEELQSRGAISVENVDDSDAVDAAVDGLDTDVEPSAEMQDSWKSLIADASELLSEVDTAAELIAETNSAAQSPHQAKLATNQSVANAVSARAGVTPDKGGAPELQEKAEQTFGVRLRNLWKRVKVSRQTLLETESVELVSLMVTIVFLWALALWVPWSIQRLLVSLDTFASASRPSMVELKD